MHYQEITEHYVQKANLSKSPVLSPSFQSSLAKRRAARRKDRTTKTALINLVRIIFTLGFSRTVVS